MKSRLEGRLVINVGSSILEAPQYCSLVISGGVCYNGGSSLVGDFS